MKPFMPGCGAELCTAFPMLSDFDVVVQRETLQAALAREAQMPAAGYQQFFVSSVKGAPSGETYGKRETLCYVALAVSIARAAGARTA